MLRSCSPPHLLSVSCPLMFPRLGIGTLFHCCVLCIQRRRVMKWEFNKHLLSEGMFSRHAESVLSLSRPRGNHHLLEDENKGPPNYSFTGFSGLKDMKLLPGTCFSKLCLKDRILISAPFKQTVKLPRGCLQMRSAPESGIIETHS